MPVLWTVFGGVMFVGAVYYLAQRARIPAPLTRNPPAKTGGQTLNALLVKAGQQ
jgi:hypothetical protein